MSPEQNPTPAQINSTGTGPVLSQTHLDRMNLAPSLEEITNGLSGLTDKMARASSAR